MLSLSRQPARLLVPAVIAIMMILAETTANGSVPASQPSTPASPPSTPESPPSTGQGSSAAAGWLDDDTGGIEVVVRSSPGESKGPDKENTKGPGQDPQTTVDSPGKQVPDLCFYIPKSSAETVAAGYDPSKGTLSTAKCPVQTNLPGAPDGERYVEHDVWTLNGAAPVAPPPPDPADLARSVASQLTVPAPVVHIGGGERVAVKVPVWLWAEEQPALTASVTAGGLTVTARAVMTSTDWSMGDPVSGPDGGGSAAAAVFSCVGGGSAPPAGVDRSVVPPCGYTYRWRSDAGRTGGSGAWPVNVVAHWTMSWQATNGAQGEIALQAASATQVAVGEWRVALVDGSGTH